MIRAKRFIHAALIALGVLVSAPGICQETVRIGVIAEFSGPFADYGAQIVAGMKTYLKLNGDVYGGKKIEILTRDTTGPSPEIAKRLAQELVTRDNVDILAGFGLTPNALAAAPISAAAKKPMVIMNAATSVITTRSPYIVRVSHTLPQDTQPMAQWAAKNGIKRVFTLVSDFGPGIDAETTFVKAFKAAGGEIVDSVRSPLSNNDFAPFLQRIKDSRPEAVFVFLPPGSQTIGFIKGYEERGLKQAGIRIIATGDLTDDGVLQAMGDPTLGVINSFHYSAAHDSPENKAFLKAYVETNGTKLRPNFMACAGYDGMAAIAEALKKTGGSVDAEKFVAALKGMRLMSPRGPIMIDPETRDIVQTVYIRRVEKVDGVLYNIEFDKYPDVKDPGETKLMATPIEGKRESEAASKSDWGTEDGGVASDSRASCDLHNRLRIREVVQNWAVWRDAGDWERFRSVWHPGARMMATWFQGSAERFIEVSREGWDKGVSILHFLGGSAIDIAGTRAIAQTKMTISQRATVDNVVCDVVCTGRFFDFFERRGDVWGIVLRQPIYEKDRLDPVDPAATLQLDAALLAAFPEGYRHLAYLQTRIGYTVKRDMPGLKGAEVERLYATGKTWLAGKPLDW